MKGLYLIVRRYESQYRQFEAPEKRPLYYAHPRKGKPTYCYRGLGREILDYYDDLIEELSPEQEELLERLEEEDGPFKTLEEAILFRDSFEEARNYEILWVTAEQGACPDKGHFLGFDAAIAPEQEPFSAVSDLFFFPLWHGADPTGHGFDEEFAGLNENGLFSGIGEVDSFISHYRKVFGEEELEPYGIWLAETEE